MGIHITEIVPLGRLTQEETKFAGNALWDKAERNRKVQGLHLHEDTITRVIEPFRPFGNQNIIQNLQTAGWIEGTNTPLHHNLTGKVGEICVAGVEPRMTFDETCQQVTGLRTRLDAAPREIDGIRMNNILLFGSAVRDSSTRPTIGDLDISVDVSFDSRHNGLSDEDKHKKAKSAWGAIVTNDDARIGFGEAKYVAQEVAFRMERQKQGLPSLDAPDRQFGIMNIWKNPQQGPSSLSEHDWSAVAEMQSQTITNNQRAQAIAQIVNGDTSPAPVKRSRARQVFEVPLAVDTQEPSAKSKPPKPDLNPPSI